MNYSTAENVTWIAQRATKDLVWLIMRDLSWFICCSLYMLLVQYLTVANLKILLGGLKEQSDAPVLAPPAQEHALMLAPPAEEPWHAQMGLKFTRLHWVFAEATGTYSLVVACNTTFDHMENFE